VDNRLVNVAVTLADSRGAGGVPATTAHGEADNTEGVGDNRALGRELDEAGASVPEDEGHEHVDDAGEEVGEPEANITGSVLGGNLEESTDVDAEVEDVQVTRDGSLGVDDNPAAVLLSVESGLLDGRLVTEKGSKRGLDEAGGESKDNDRDDEDTERGVGNSDDLRNSGNDEDNVGDETDGGTNNNGLETSPAL